MLVLLLHVIVEHCLVVKHGSVLLEFALHRGLVDGRALGRSALILLLREHCDSAILLDGMQAEVAHLGQGLVQEVLIVIHFVLNALRHLSGSCHWINHGHV